MQDEGGRRSGGNGAGKPDGKPEDGAAQDSSAQGGSAQGPAETPRQDEPAKAPLPLFYRAPRPLHQELFGGKGLRKEGDYRFAAEAHAVAVHLQEFRFAAAHYPIVFSDEAVPAPLAVLGLQHGRNLFLDAEGRWARDAYIPAYVRRYPFVVGQGAKPEEPILYLDSASDLVVDLEAEPEADPLFEDGAPSARTKQGLEFCTAFQRQVPVTQEFLEALGEHELLERKEVRLDLPGAAQPQVLSGLRILDEAKFNALPDEVFLDWRKRGWIAAAYWHWASMDNFQRLVARM